MPRETKFKFELEFHTSERTGRVAVVMLSDQIVGVAFLAVKSGKLMSI